METVDEVQVTRLRLGQQGGAEVVGGVEHVPHGAQADRS